MPFDPATGQVQVGNKMRGGLEVRERSHVVSDIAVELDGEDLVFRYNEETVGLPNRASSVESSSPGADNRLAYDLARLVEIDGSSVGFSPLIRTDMDFEALVLYFSESSAFACRVDESPHPGDKSSGIDPKDRLISLARRIGPLFGMDGRVGPYEFREPVDAWLAAAGAMSVSALASGVEMGDPLASGALNPYMRVLRFDCLDGSGTRYVTFLNLPLPEAGKFQNDFTHGLDRGGMWTNISAEFMPGASAVSHGCVRWCENGSLCFMEDVVVGQLTGRLMVTEASWELLHSLSEPSEYVLTTEESIASLFAQDLTTWFSQGARFGWRRNLEAKRPTPRQIANGETDYGRGSSFGVCVPDAITRLWLALARTYSVDIVKICEHCGRPFSDVAGGTAKCCSAECTRAKNTKKSRARQKAQTQAGSTH